MALNNKQPYLPLYIDDWMNNTKLKLSTSGAHGLLISIMCLMHKEKDYGKLSLNQKFKKTGDQIKNFCLQLNKLTCFNPREINPFFNELIDNKILVIEDDCLICERMVKNFNLSKIRAESGKKGGRTKKVTQ